MKSTRVIIILTIFLQGCALINPHETSDTAQAEPHKDHIVTPALTEQHTPYTILGDAHLPGALRHQYEYSAAPSDVSKAIESIGAAQTQSVTDIASLALDSLVTSANENDIPPADSDIWNRIRAGFVFETYDNPRIDQQLKWFASHQEYLDRVVERADPYMHYIVKTLEENNIPLEIALLPIVESAFKPFAYSHGRASGIWQFIPSTGKLYGLQQNWWYDGRRDVYASTQAAVKLLNNLQKEFNGDWMLALAAYNSGSGNVRRAISYNKKRGKPTDFFSLRLPPETKSYVPKLLALKRLVADPTKYNITLQPIADTPYLERVELDSQIDLALAAELADIELETLYQLNPGYNRWATSPEGANHLLLPLDNIDIFKSNLSEYPPEKRINWVRHQIKQGETISTIAAKYHVSTNTIKRVNHLRSNQLRAGHSLTIPVASKSPSSYTLSASQRKKALQNTPHSGIKVTHIVQSGDTLWDIAQRHNVGVRSLAKWNGMAPRDPLSVGQQLIIWSRNNNAQETNFIHVSTPPQREITQRIGYRVRKGDSLALIAQKFRVTINELLQWNKKVSKSAYLQPGQHLVVYVDVTQTSGRT